MKKVISMLLMLCAIFTFSACSSDDDPVVVNPVTGVTIPATAQIGSEVTIRGTGFAAGQTILLQLAEQEPVEVDAMFSANGIKFDVPYTLTEGKASVTLKVGDNNWPLGSITLTAPANPVTAYSIPSEMAFGKELAISGIGFKEGDRLKFVPATMVLSTSIVIPAISLPVNVSADGATVNVAEMSEGDYNVSLERGANSWYLGSTYVYQPKRIKSIYFENGLLAMIGKTSLTMNFSYNADGTIKAIESPEGVSYDFAYTDNTIVTTSVLSDNPLEYNLVNGKIVKSIAAAAEEDYPTTKYNYWTYNDDNKLASVTNKDAWYRGLVLGEAKYDSASINLSSIAFGGDVAFTSYSKHAVPGTIDVRYLLDMFSYIYQGEDIFVGMLLNKNVSSSSYLPAKEFITYMVPNADYTAYENKVAEVNLNTSFDNNVLTIDFLSFKDLEMITGTYGSKIVVTYENE